MSGGSYRKIFCGDLREKQPNFERVRKQVFSCCVEIFLSLHSETEDVPIARGVYVRASRFFPFLFRALEYLASRLTKLRAFEVEFPHRDNPDFFVDALTQASLLTLEEYSTSSREPSPSSV